MSVDVVIVTHQSRSHLAACLGGLPAELHPVVVDNASSDGSPDLAGELGAQVLRNDRNLGFAAAANQGARRGTAARILFLNPDARLEDADLRRLVAALDNPATAVVGPRLLHPDGGEQRAWWPFPSPWATWVEACGWHLLRPPRLGRHGEAPFVVGACLLVRRDVFEVLGGFDERFWLYGEEADLCRRVWQAGWRVRHVPSAVARHVGGASGEGQRELTFEQFQLGTERFIAKHHGRAGLLLHRLGLCFGSLLRFVVLLARPRDPRLEVRARVLRRLGGRLVTAPLRPERAR